MSLLISKNYPSQVNTLLTQGILSSPENKAVLPASHVILPRAETRTSKSSVCTANCKYSPCYKYLWIEICVSQTVNEVIFCKCLLKVLVVRNLCLSHLSYASKSTNTNVNDIPHLKINYHYFKYLWIDNFASVCHFYFNTNHMADTHLKS